MEIGIFGCSHSFGRGLTLAETLFGFYDREPNALDQLDSGYAATLSKMYPQHNFEVIPVLGGGNQDIINNLINCIDERPKDMYIVQMTQWHRFTFGCLNYSKQAVQHTENLGYYMYDTRSYFQQRDPLVNFPHLPNWSLSFKPQQNPSSEVKGTGSGQFMWKETFTPDGFAKAREFYEIAMEVMIRDHIPSRLNIDNNWSIFKMLHHLSKHHNIWYFYWNMPFGDAVDFQSYDRRFAEQVRNHVAMMYSKWNSLDQSKQIQQVPIHNMLISEVGEKVYIAKMVEDRGLHLTEAAHNLLVSYLLKNKNFKEALDASNS